MAVAELIVSRRALLAAAWAGTAIAAPGRRPGASRASRDPGLDPGSSLSLSPPQQGSWTPDQVRGAGGIEANWHKALARYRVAERALAAVQGAPDTLFDRVNGRFNRALARLLRTPAPTAAALALKLELVRLHSAWEFSFGDAALAGMHQDARRLAERR